MTRTDLYTNVHTGLRALLFENTARVARTTWDDPADAGRTLAGLRAMVSFLDEHAEHEDAVLMPELRRLAPELAAELDGDHTRLGGLQAELAALLERIAAAPAGERPSLGQRLRHRLHQLVAAHLTHMGREEIDANRVLQAHFSDGALQALEGRIVGAIAPPRAAEWFAVILPAIAPAERTRLLRGLQEAMPPAAFAGLTAPARAALGERVWGEALGAAAV